MFEDDIEWRAHKICGDTYFVSSNGDVRNARGIHKKPTLQKIGYLAFSFETRGVRRTVRAHVLVAEVFIGPRPRGAVVRHLDGVRRNNQAANIAYGTHQDNSDDARLHGTISRGSGNGQHRLTERAVAAIRRLDGLVPAHVIASWLKVSPSIVGQAQRHETWRHVDMTISTEDALLAVFRSRKLKAISGDTEAAEAIIAVTRVRRAGKQP